MTKAGGHKQPTPTEAKETKLEKITVLIDSNKKRRLKSKAGIEKTTITKIVTAAIDSYLELE